MKAGRWRWIVMVLVLVLGAFSARYVSLGSGGHHKFDIGGEVLDLPLISPTILGWILPGDRARIESAQFSPDGRWMYLSAMRGEGDQVATVTMTRPFDGVLVVDLRLVASPIPGARPAGGILFGTRVGLDEPVWNQKPPITIDVSTDRAVVIGSYKP